MLPGISLVVQWLRISLPTQGTRVQSLLVQKDSTYCGAAKPVSHSYWACIPWAVAPQQEKAPQWEACAPKLQREAPLPATRESPCTATKTLHRQKLINLKKPLSSVQCSCSVVSDSLQPHGLQHARLLCPSLTPGVHPNPYPLNQWCHPTISFSIVPFSSCPQSFPASGSFQMSQLFASGGQSIAVSASASVLPMNIQDWFPLGWTGWISLQSKELSRVLSNLTVQKHQFFGAQLSL